jgi:hypothetical protein
MNFPAALRAAKSGNKVTLSVAGVKPPPRAGEPVASKMNSTSLVRTPALNAAGSSGPPHPRRLETLYHCDRTSGYPTVRIPVDPDSGLKELIGILGPCVGIDIDACSTSRLAEQRNASWITAKRCDVISNPFNRKSLIEEAEIVVGETRRACEAKEIYWVAIRMC